MWTVIRANFLLRENGVDYSRVELSKHMALEALTTHGTPFSQGFLPRDQGELIREKLNFKFGRMGDAWVEADGDRYTFAYNEAQVVGKIKAYTRIDKSLFDELWPQTQDNRVESVRLDYPWRGVTLESYTDRDLLIARMAVRLKRDLVPYIGRNITYDAKYLPRNLAR